MNKKNFLLIGALVVVAVILLVVGRLAVPVADENAVIISVDGKVVDRVPLSAPRTVTVTQESGAVNVVEVTANGAVMLSSTCENQSCVHMGEVTLDNWEYRPNQTFIICLPNKVTVELAVAE